MQPSLIAEGIGKTFTLHLQGGVRLPVLAGLGFAVRPGECVVLDGPSGIGKSTVLRAIYGSYGVDRGRILIRHDGAMIDLASAGPREVLAVRRRTLGYVSQFLRVVPRVPTVEVVAEPLLAFGCPREPVLERARSLLACLRLPERLWEVPPATFSGGEQQRVNLARAFVHPYPVLLLDEPTASLDAENRAIVVELVRERLAEGAAMLAILHDRQARDAIATRIVELAGVDRAA
ncbi:MAG TPA: phosphonate C-P lyase system protein PhnL [Geminicoccus sp.]|uniref:phosphonate C-P lyase system protein PhnL n=1 Tax=Geminicoccus sp. TaxID=2024832 RepID=UPI002C68459E|nr:phosphonate C-P lyase system protein PhnL [Geminicoccus sp.]HWL70808.1 phosphonate C-P lyase system protein PhnL [Geminicoccus sp.]